jgi:hypothetical protein
MSTWFVTKGPKTYNGQKTAFSTNVAGKAGYLHAENLNYTYVFHPIQVSIQSGLSTLIKTWNFDASTERSKEYTNILEIPTYLSLKL